MRFAGDLTPLADIVRLVIARGQLQTFVRFLLAKKALARLIRGRTWDLPKGDTRLIFRALFFLGRLPGGGLPAQNAILTSTLISNLDEVSLRKSPHRGNRWTQAGRPRPVW